MLHLGRGGGEGERGRVLAHQYRTGLAQRIQFVEQRGKKFYSLSFDTSISLKHYNLCSD